MSSGWPPREPQLQHAALRLTARGWETMPLPAPDGSGALVVALDLHSHEAVVEHSSRPAQRVPLTPDRPVGEVTRQVLAAVGRAVRWRSIPGRRRCPGARRSESGGPGGQIIRMKDAGCPPGLAG